MSVLTRIKNNQILDSGIWANAKIIPGSIVGSLFNSSMTITSDFTITGNLTVQGAATYLTVASTNTYVNDPLIVLNNAFAGSNSYDLGFIFNRGSDTNQAFYWDESSDEFRLIATSETGTTYGSITAETSFANIRLGNVRAQYNLTATTIDATGFINTTGNISGAVLNGGEINSTGLINTTANVSAAVTNTGALNVTGLSTLNTINASGFINAAANVSASGLLSATLNVTGLSTLNTINASGFINAAGNISAAVLNGGAINSTGLINTTANVSAAATNTGALNVTGLSTLNTINASGFINAAGNISASEVNSATLNITGLSTLNTINASGFINAAGNISAAVLNGGAINSTGLINTTANVSAAVTNTGALNVTGLSTINTINASGFINAAANVSASGLLGATLNVTGLSTLATINASGFINAAGNISAASMNTGTLGVTGNISVGAGLNSTDTTQSTNTTTGAIITAGGLGIAKNLNVGGDAVVTGNLTVNGVTTTVNSSTLTVTDLNVVVANGAGSSAAADGAGLTVDGASATILYTHATTSWNFNKPVIGSSYANFTGNVLGSAFIGASLNVSGNVSATEINTGTVKATGLINTTANISAAVTNTGALNVTGLSTLNTINASGFINAAGNISAAVVNAGEINSTGFINTTGNVSAAVTNTGALNVTGTSTVAGITASGFINTAGNVSASTVNASHVNASGNVSATEINTGTIKATGLINTTGNVSAATVNAGQINTTGNVLAQAGVFNALTVNGNETITGYLNVTGNVLADITNVSKIITANVVAAVVNVIDEYAGTIVASTINVTDLSASGTVYANNATDTTSLTTGALIVAGGTAVGKTMWVGEGARINSTQSAETFHFLGQGGSTNNSLIVADAAKNALVFGGANVTVQDGVVAKFNSTGAIKVPTGTSSERPGSAGNVDVTGLLRFNTTSTNLEFFDGTDWTAAGSEFTVISTNNFVGDGADVTFTLSSASTTAGTFVMINGVVQIPTTAYSVTGTTLTFTEAPAAGDAIDARVIITTATVSTLASGNGYNTFDVNTPPYANITAGTASPTVRVSVDGVSGTVTFTNDVVINGQLTVKGDTAGNINIGDQATDKVQLQGTIVYDQTALTAAGTNLRQLDSFDTASYHTSKYLVQVRDAAQITSAEVLVAHDGTNVLVTTYAMLNTHPTGALGNFSANIVSGAVKLWYTPSLSTNANIKVQTTYIV